MDMLFQRYSDPMTFLDRMIRSGRLYEFVCKVLKLHNDEKQEKFLLEVWLHKIVELSYSEFKERVMQKQKEPEILSSDEMKSTIHDSMEIISGFVPDDFQK